MSMWQALLIWPLSKVSAPHFHHPCRWGQNTTPHGANLATVCSVLLEQSQPHPFIHSLSMAVFT